MNKKITFVLGLAALLLFSFSLALTNEVAAKELKRIPADQIRQVTPPLAAGAKDYCYLTYAAWQPAYWVNWFKQGDKIAVYYDPDECGFSQNYPFQLTDVHLILTDHAEVGSVTVRFSVEVMCPDICDGPGIEIWKSQPYRIDTFYPDIVEIWFEDTVCLDKPFFFNVEYLSDYPEGSMPSFIFEEPIDTGWPDTCYQWVWYGQPSWIEWYNDLGGMGAGWIILGISGYVADQANCGWWYWKPDTLPQAPSGMPDFDQNQRDWVAYCGPTAVANCLWWFDAVPTAGMDPADFIELLAGYFGTTSGGTYVDSIQLGLEEYFADYGFALKETTYWEPDFYEMEDSLKACQDIILLLGFWWWDDYSGSWYREGGHFVTMAGVNSEKKEIAISDPDRDQVVRYPWWPGRVRLADHPPWGAYPPDFHNDPNYVSHDIYISLLFPEFPSPGSEVWDLADYCYGQTFPAVNVPHRFEAYSRISPKHYEYFHTEVEAAIMICPKPPPDTLRNHFKTWQVEPKDTLLTVVVEDQFMQDVLTLDRIDFLSNPTRKDTFEIVDSLEHLTWYRAHGRDTLLQVEYSNQFGTDTVRIDSVKYLLLPTSKEFSPFPESLDHYKAYRIKDPVMFERVLELEDQFDLLYGTPEVIDSLKPIYFLTPALKNMPPPMFDSVTHYVAYEIFPERFFPLTVNTSDQFGEHVLQVDTSKILLVPTVKLWVEPPPNDPPEIGQPDFLEGYVDSVVEYEITGNDPDGDVILDEASIDIQPGCGSGYSITRTSGHGTSSGTWQVTWDTEGCTPCDTHMVIHDLTDEHGLVGYCTTYVHLSEEFDTTWYWKPPYDDYAPNGMPDIEQRQDGWMKSGADQWSFCGPAAVANCFKWFDSKYNDPPGFPGDGMDQFPLVRDYLDDLPPLVGYDDHDPWNVDHVGTAWGPAIGPPPATLQPFVPGPQIPGGGLPPWGELVERLAWFFDADGIQSGYCGHTGTNVMDMQAGIQEWLEGERFVDAVPQFVRGDVNGDGTVNMSDAVECAAGGPFPCDDAADVNDDGAIDIADCVYLTDYLTAGGPAPPRPFPDCGKDRTADGLGCGDYPLCPWSNTLADSLCEVTTPMPSFAEVESLVHKCEDVILLLGFWFDQEPQQFIRGDVNADGLINVSDIVTLITGPPYLCDDAADVNDDGALNDLDSAYLWDYIFNVTDPPPPPFTDCGPDPTYDNLGCADFPPCPGAGEVWRRIGGHYVTVAGVNSERFKIAFSDPFVDNAEFGAPGRVGDGTIIPHDFPHDPTVHNDEGNVSHDIYDVEIPSISPGGEWWLPGYAINGDPGYWVWNFYDQNVPEEFEPMTAPWNGTSPIHTEVEYCVHISPWDYRGDANGDGIVNIGDVVYIVTFLYKGGPAPVPMSEADVNCDGIVNLGDIVFLIGYLFRNGPVPRCCDP